MDASLKELILSYDANSPLESASTIPSLWHTDPRIADLERLAFSDSLWLPGYFAFQVSQVRRIWPTIFCGSAPGIGSNFCTRPAKQSATYKFPSWSVVIP